MARRGRKGANTVRALLIGIALLLAVAALLPLVETNVWFVRILDFPRAQYLVALLFVGTLLVLGRTLHRAAGGVAGALVVSATVYSAHKLWTYPEFAEKMAEDVASCPDRSRIRVLVANVQMSNRHAETLIEMVERHQPDLFLAMETNAWWDERLSVLAAAYPHHVEHIDDEHFGIHLFSKYRLAATEVLFLSGEDTPAVFTDVVLPDGERVAFYGVHPRPPAAFQSSAARDGVILAAALSARRSEHPAIVAGDLNAVPWERVVRRALRVGQLLDPRVGRGLAPSYVRAPPVLEWPIDHVLHQAGLGLMAFDVLPRFGSDHRPVLVDLCRSTALADRQAAPPLAEGDLEEAARSVRAGLTEEAQRRILTESGT